MRRPPLTQTRRHTRRGFTLIEVLLVLAILGVIAAIVVPNLLGTGEKANIRAAKLNIGEIEKLVTVYAMDHNNKFPESLEVLTQPYEKDGVQTQAITAKVPEDPWGVPFNYDATGKHHTNVKMPDIWSSGPDGKDDGGEGDDVNNWSELEK